jgi:predicted GNAT superfamily acetyltransferase
LVNILLRVLEDPGDLIAVEDLQRQVWSGSETEIVPAHMLIAASHNGGLVIAAFDEDADAESPMVGFVYGFPGLYSTPDGPRPKHCSHMMGVLPAYRDQGIGYSLKRAQWQMVRNQGLDRITWTFDPLLSRNAHLNITRLGAVCNTYLRSVDGELRDDINTGLPTDRFQVDWWVNTERVARRLSRQARPSLDLAHFLAAGAKVLNPSRTDADGFPRPAPDQSPKSPETGPGTGADNAQPAIWLVEIPADFSSLKESDPQLAIEWRLHIRAVCEDLFARGYLVTDFVYLPGSQPRSFYVFSHGESTL